MDQQNTRRVSIRSQLNEADWLLINRMVIHQTVGNKYRWLMAVIALGVLLITLYMGYKTWENYTCLALYREVFPLHERIFYLIEEMFIPIALWIVFAVLVRTIQRYPQAVTRSMLKRPENKVCLMPTKITFSDEGIDIEREYVKGTHQWPSVVKVMDSPHMLIIFVSLYQGFYIKKSDLSDEELQCIMQLLRQHYSGQMVVIER